MAQFRDQQDYRVFRSGRLSGYVHREYGDEDSYRAIADLLESPPSSKKTLYRRSQYRETFIVKIPTDGFPQETFLKCIHFKSYWRLILIDSLMPSVALRYLINAEALRSIGINTPRIIAVAEEKFCLGTRRSFILTEPVRNSATIREYLGSTPTSPHAGTEFTDRRKIIHYLAEMVHRLHCNNIFHLDLKAENILVNSDGLGTLSLVLIDLDDTVTSSARAGMMPRILRFVDLLMLYYHFFPISHLKDRLRFLAAYSGRKVRNNRIRRFQSLLASSPLLFRTCKSMRAINLVSLLRRLFLCLRILR
jgi:tRNA A-37 threonylcarbamoyl transferase component Bud32